MAEPAGPPAGRLRRLAGTVRFRVTALASVVLLVVLAATDVGLVAAQRRALTGNLDEALGEVAAGLEPAVRVRAIRPVLTPFGDEDAMAQVVDGSGRVIAASPGLAGRAALAPTPAGGGTRVRTVSGLTRSGARFRILSRRVTTPAGTGAIHVAGSVDDIDDSLHVLTVSLATATPAVALLLALLVWLAVGRALRPVEAIRAQVAAIGGRELHRRVPQPGTGDEIDRLAATMNAMLARVEATAERERRFVADASHELRTPLTRIRTELEVDLAHPGDADPGATHRSVLEEVGVLQRLVDDLLLLARADARRADGWGDEVDLDDVVLAEAGRVRRSAGERIRVDTAGVGAARVRGDRDQLARAVRNLTDNAVRHARSTLALGLAEVEGTARLTVADDGPGIAPDQRERVFDRFARLDDARAADAGGSGLGLAIARGIVEGHHGTIAVDPDTSAGARFVVTLPLDGAGRG